MLWCLCGLSNLARDFVTMCHAFTPVGPAYMTPFVFMLHISKGPRETAE